MKLSQIILASAVVAFAMVSCKNSGYVSLKNDVDSVSYCIGANVGNSLKQADVPNFNQEVFAAAVKEVMAGKESKIKEEDANAFMQAYFMKLQQTQSEKHLKEGKAFLEKNKSKSGVITTASGLQYEVIKEGTGAQPKAEEIVSVNYKGTLIDGTVFESSYDRGEPASFPVNRVIPGWTEVLQLMKVGSKYKVYIPSELAYGENPRQGGKIKPNMVLIFEMELLSVEAPKPEAATPPAGFKMK